MSLFNITKFVNFLSKSNIDKMNSCILKLQNLLGIEKVLDRNSIQERYSHIWKMSEGLDAIGVVLPGTTKELSDVLKICNEEEQKVVIHGGLTNLVGGTETVSTDLVISLERMNKILEIDTASRTATVEAGVVLENLRSAVAEKQLIFPLNFGAKGSAQVGGMVSNNAGGLQVLRYGMTRNLVLGIEAVLANGTIISSMKKIIKDNSGYDLKQLFIGSEGTLGIVTKVVLRLIEAPTSRSSAFVALNSYDKVVTFLKHMDQGLGGQLSGYELIWADTYQCMTSPDAVQLPMSRDYKYYVLLESLGTNIDSDLNQMIRLLEYALEKDLILDAVPAQTESDLEWFWRIREDVHVIKSACTYDHHFDVSLPIASIGEYAAKTITELKKLDFVNAVYTFGHVADGNIHFIVDRTSTTQDDINTINEIVYQPLEKLNGSISAEHGIGVHKKAYLKYSRSEAEINLMKLLKRSLDPNGILNPRNIF